MISSKALSFLENHKRLVWLLAVFAWSAGMLLVPDEDWRNFVQYWVRTLDDAGLSRAYEFSYGHGIGPDGAGYINYPPVYLVYLWLVRKPALSGVLPGYFFARLGPAILHFGFSAWLFRRFDKSFAWFWLLNPGFYLTGAVWTQTDEVLCIEILMFLLAVQKEKSSHAYFWFGLACLTKMQGVALLPVLVWYLYRHKGQWRRELPRLFAAGAVSLSAYIPFIMHSGIQPVLDLYFKGVEYNWGMTAKAHSLHGWSLLLTLASDKAMSDVMCFLGNTSMLWFLACILVFVLFIKKGVPVLPAYAMYLYCVAFLSPNLNERSYLYPMIVFMLLAVQERPYMHGEHAKYLLYGCAGGYLVRGAASTPLHYRMGSQASHVLQAMVLLLFWLACVGMFVLTWHQVYSLRKKQEMAEDGQ